MEHNEEPEFFFDDDSAADEDFNAMIVNVDAMSPHIRPYWQVHCANAYDKSCTHLFAIRKSDFTVSDPSRGTYPRSLPSQICRDGDVE